MHPVEWITRHVFPDTCGKARVCQQAVPDRLVSELLVQQPWQNQSSLRHTLRQYQQRSAGILCLERQPHHAQQIRCDQHHVFHLVCSALFTSDVPDTADLGVSTHGKETGDKAVFSGLRGICLREVQPAGRGQFCLEPRHRHPFFVGNCLYKLQGVALGAFCLRKAAAVGQSLQAVPAVESDLAEQHQQYQQNNSDQFHCDSFGTGTVSSSSDTMRRQVS